MQEGSEALTIVKSVTELDGVGAWPRLHANYSRRTLGREKKWKAMMSELGGDAKIPDL